MSYDIKIFSGNAVTNAKKAYALELAEIKDEKNRSNLASILLNRDMNESGNISLAFYLSKCTDADARLDGFKTATSMIERVTGLKKSMISNYVKVGKFLTNESGMFEMPEYAKGFSVTQLTEILAKKTPKEFESMVNDGLIDNTMSAKTLRDACKPESIIDTDGVELDDNKPETADNKPETADDKTEKADSKPENKSDIRYHYLYDGNNNKVATIAIIECLNGFDYAGIYALNDLRIGDIATEYGI